MMRRHVSGWLLATWMTALCGCQSWSQLGQGIPGGSRVPPPGTGTYQVPSSYYNGTGAKPAGVSSTGQSTTNGSAAVRTASAQALPAGGGSGVSTANWQVPTVDQMRSGINNTAAAALENANNRANQAVQAGTSRAAAAVERATDPLLAGLAQPPTGAGSPSNAAGTNSMNSPNSPSPNPPSGASSIPASRSLSDESTTDASVPPLDWQPPQ